MGEGEWGWGVEKMGVGLDLESADAVGVYVCVCVCVCLCPAGLGKPPSILPKPEPGRGVCSALSFPSAWERPNQASMTFPAPARARGRPGGSALEKWPHYSFLVYLREALEEPKFGGPELG